MFQMIEELEGLIGNFALQYSNDSLVLILGKETEGLTEDQILPI